MGREEMENRKDRLFTPASQIAPISSESRMKGLNRDFASRLSRDGLAKTMGGGMTGKEVTSL